MPGNSDDVIEELDIMARLGKSATLRCDIGNIMDCEWKKNSGSRIRDLKSLSKLATARDGNIATMQLRLNNVQQEDSGTYECSGLDWRSGETYVCKNYLIVSEVPEVRVDFAKAVGADSVYLNWTVNKPNDPVKLYRICRTETDTDHWIDCSEKISGERISYVVEGLEKSTAYNFRITARNSVGRSEPDYWATITTLPEGSRFYNL